jgi:hypothetical protein
MNQAYRIAVGTKHIAVSLPSSVRIGADEELPHFSILRWIRVRTRGEQRCGSSMIGASTADDARGARDRTDAYERSRWPCLAAPRRRDHASGERPERYPPRRAAATRVRLRNRWRRVPQRHHRRAGCRQESFHLSGSRTMPMNDGSSNNLCAWATRSLSANTA